MGTVGSWACQVVHLSMPCRSEPVPVIIMYRKARPSRDGPRVALLTQDTAFAAGDRPTFVNVIPCPAPFRLLQTHTMASVARATPKREV